MRHGLLDLHERHLAAPEAFPPGIRGLDRPSDRAQGGSTRFRAARGASRVWFVPNQTAATEASTTIGSARDVSVPPLTHTPAGRE